MDEVLSLGWLNDSVIPIFQPPSHLDIYDIQEASYAIRLAVTTAAGIINRPQPRVYLITGDDDIFWLTQFSIPHDLAPAKGDAALGAILDTYHTSIQGLIIYDPQLPDTVNIATTLAGQRTGIVVSPDLAQSLQKTYGLSVLVDLRIYQWRTRLQAYRWAQQNLLAASSTRLVAGLSPDNTTGIRSFLVATCTFIYWLDSRDYLPDFSVGLLSERSLLQQILQHFPPGGAHLGWFIDESSGVKLTSQAAMVVLASDFFVNLEVWTAIRPALPVLNVKGPEVPASDNKIYLSFTISDGDNLQYLQHRMQHLWRDTVRGTLPIGWTLSPTIASAIPALATYYLSTATANDEFIAGPSGFGYIFPSYWPAEHFPLFFQRTGQLMQMLNLKTLEILDAPFLESSGLPLISGIKLSGMVCTDSNLQARYVEALKPYGLQGIISGAGIWLPQWKKIDGIPFYLNLGLAGSVESTLSLIKMATLTHPQRPLFLNIYILAWSMTPSDLQQVVAQLSAEYEIVLPGTLLALLAKRL